jgi:hypothetical protein
VRRQIFRVIVGMVAFLATIFVLFAAYDILGIRAQGDAPLAALQQFCSFEAQQDYSYGIGVGY